ncbi:tyrosine-protein phosphatase [Asaia krungthepensis]|uniref:Protein tyrosine/serine phosphatase n=1 Tax=Asaia krungthepensis NRIC 0535 TaxID=1307925 RepID=A0ABQ0Q0S4_9PROT|nr:tyrosine-protein phosphatase [Asaia krungthepensis]GBQ86334.1 protein tyrosine/serine phosphatase [Asaia krungthepensis NRIC 0535]
MFLKKTTLALLSMTTLSCIAMARAETPGTTSVQLEMVPRYTLTWPASLGTVDIFASLTPDASAMKPVQHHVTAQTAQVTAPFQGTHRVYFFIKPVSGKGGEWIANRVLPLEGVANFRDMGGYETADHHHVRWGEFYRSAAPSGLTPADYAFVDTLGIKSVTDLRTQAEQQKQPTHWQGASPAFFPSDKPTLPADMTDRSKLATLDEPRAKALMESFYTKMPSLYAPELKGIFARLLAHQTPTLTHCTAGKDRTGFASALILYALGVPEETILRDYAMSGDLLRAHLTPSFRAAMADHQNGGAMAASPSMRAMLNSDPDYLKAAFASIRQHYGSIDAYMAQEIGVGPQEVATLRRLYLD